MADYALLIDDETRAFIKRTYSFYPAEAVDFTIEQQRAVYDRLCRAFFAGYPEGVTAYTGAIETPTRAIPIRTYRNALPNPTAVVVYYHGGGFVLGGLDSHDDVCAELCDKTGYEFISVDYRLAPEHRHPAAFDDAVAAFEWVARNRDWPIVLCGDSAGGNLAAAVCHATRDHPRAPAAQMLIYPGLGGDRTKGSYVTHAEAPMLTVRDLDFYRGIRGDAPGDPTCHPLADRDFTRLPPTIISTAECDPLSSDGEAYRDRALAAGGRVAWVEEPGLVHGWLRGRHSVGRAEAAFDRIAAALGALGKGEWPY